MNRIKKWYSRSYYSGRITPLQYLVLGVVLSCRSILGLIVHWGRFFSNATCSDIAGVLSIVALRIAVGPVTMLTLGIVITAARTPLRAIAIVLAIMIAIVVEPQALVKIAKVILVVTHTPDVW